MHTFFRKTALLLALTQISHFLYSAKLPILTAEEFCASFELLGVPPEEIALRREIDSSPTAPEKLYQEYLLSQQKKSTSPRAVIIKEIVERNIDALESIKDPKSALNEFSSIKERSYFQRIIEANQKNQQHYDEIISNKGGVLTKQQFQFLLDQDVCWRQLFKVCVVERLYEAYLSGFKKDHCCDDNLPCFDTLENLSEAYKALLIAQKSGSMWALTNDYKSLIKKLEPYHIQYLELEKEFGCDHCLAK